LEREAAQVLFAKRVQIEGGMLKEGEYCRKGLEINIVQVVGRVCLVERGERGLEKVGRRKGGRNREKVVNRGFGLRIVEVESMLGVEGRKGFESKELL
jgi:hypothetical protein